MRFELENSLPILFSQQQLAPLDENEEEHEFVEPIEGEENPDEQLLPPAEGEEGAIEGAEGATPEGGEGVEGEAAPAEGEESKGLCFSIIFTIFTYFLLSCCDV